MNTRALNLFLSVQKLFYFKFTFLAFWWVQTLVRACGSCFKPKIFKCYFSKRENATKCQAKTFVLAPFCKNFLSNLQWAESSRSTDAKSLMLLRLIRKPGAFESWLSKTADFLQELCQQKSKGKKVFTGSSEVKFWTTFFSFFFLRPFTKK